MHLRLDPGVHRLRSRSSTVDAVAHLVRVGWSVRVVDVSTVRDKASLLEAFAVGFDAPAWVGRNWDALSRTPFATSPGGSRASAGGPVVVGPGRLGARQDADWTTLCDILVEASDHWRSTASPLGRAGPGSSARSNGSAASRYADAPRDAAATHLAGDLVAD